jgi:two-component system LytT family response regulator
MLNILIVDDERLARAELKRLLAPYPSVKLVAEAANAAEAKQQLAAHAIDLVFLDIQMPEVTGLELAAELDPRLQFVFCTAYNSFALDAFALNALDYLVKPLDPHRLQKTIERASQRAVIQTNGDQTTANYLPEQHGLLLKFGDINRIVRLHEISRFESIGNHTAVYTPFGKSFILSSLSRIESRLDPQLFFKSSRADIIRIDAIRQLEPGIATGTMLAALHDGSTVEVSRRQMQNLKQLFGSI